jgi:hypothetical protein
MALWQSHFQIATILFPKEFSTLNVNIFLIMMQSINIQCMIDI